MSLRKLKFAIFGNIYQADKSVGIQHLLSSLERRRASVSMERAFYDFLVKTRGVKLDGVEPFDGKNVDADYVVSMGGDGALLTDGKRAYFAPPLKVKVRSSVGAGDSMPAGICMAL